MVSTSPFGDKYEFVIDSTHEIQKLDNFVKNGRKNVVIQGIGFVGAAMIAAVSTAKNSNGQPRYNVIGIDLADENNYWKIAKVNAGKPPIVSSDENIEKAYQTAGQQKNIMATYSDYAYQLADIVVIDIHLDITKKELGNTTDYHFTYDIYREAVRKIAQNIKENTLVIVETTVPPGTTEQVIVPLFEKEFKIRNLDAGKVHIVHSYERVMPGQNYYNSIVNFYRVYSAITDEAKSKANDFFESFINTQDYPLHELHSTNASEMSKVLENSYRATNIAFIKEWTEFAHKAKVNLFEVVDAIRVRPTHQNIMLPGFGVGGYCLTKDALLADWAFQNNFGSDVPLNLSLQAISINDLMPGFSVDLLKTKLSNFSGITIALMGISYLNDVADTRNSPSALFYDFCSKEGAKLLLHDPYMKYWPEKQLEIFDAFEKLQSAECVVFAVRHKQYLQLDAKAIMSYFPQMKILLDANNIITDETAEELRKNNITMLGVGKGHWQ